MNGPDWLAEHAIDAQLVTFERVVELVEEWMRTDPDGQRRVWQLAHPGLYREDPLAIHNRTVSR